jgi:hypothetical protein
MAADVARQRAVSSSVRVTRRRAGCGVGAAARDWGAVARDRGAATRDRGGSGAWPKEEEREWKRKEGKRKGRKGKKKKKEKRK